MRGSLEVAVLAQVNEWIAHGLWLGREEAGSQRQTDPTQLGATCQLSGGDGTPNSDFQCKIQVGALVGKKVSWKTASLPKPLSSPETA